MSLSRGCLVIERQPGQWFCVVTHDEHDYDFQDGYNIYGPKKTADAALEAMHAQEANPGSHSEIDHAAVTDFHRKLVDEGLKRRQEQQAFDRKHGWG